MSQFIDFEKLNKHFEDKSKKTIKYNDVKDHLEKVAFDIVRFAPEYEEAIDGLWRIETTNDGEVILALYSSDSDVVKTASTSEWNVIPDKSLSEINIFYKNEPVTTIKAASLNVESSEVKSFCRHLINKFATDNSAKKLLFRDLDKKTKNYFFTKYPELLNNGK